MIFDFEFFVSNASMILLFSSALQFCYTHRAYEKFYDLSVCQNWNARKCGQIPFN